MRLALRTQLEPFLGKLLLEHPPHPDPRLAVDLVVLGPARRGQDAEGHVGELRTHERARVSQSRERTFLQIRARPGRTACAIRGILSLKALWRL